MSAPTWRIVARWVPAGSLIAEGFEQTFSMPWPDVEDGVWALRQWAKGSTCGGTVLINVYDADGAERRSAFQGCDLPTRGVYPARSTGYPPHACGAPMVPRDLVGAALTSYLPPGDEPLVCVGCYERVKGTPDERLRANAAAKYDRERSRQGGA